jgi:hypothetical protein
MRQTGRALAVLATLAVLAAAVAGGCGGATAAQPVSPPTGPPSTSADITGTVHDMTRSPGGGALPVLLVVDDGAIQGLPARASVSITRDTVVWTLERARGTARDLGVGQMVSVWFAGPAVGSDPLQAKAAVVRILLDD